MVMSVTVKEEGQCKKIVVHGHVSKSGNAGKSGSAW